VFRLIRTGRLKKLTAQAQTLLQAQKDNNQFLSTIRKLDSELTTERQHSQDLRDNFKHLREEYEQHMTAHALICEERITQAQRRAAEAADLAEERLRELKKLHGRSAAPAPDAAELLYRFKNLVLTDITITLRTTPTGAEPGYACPQVELRLDLLCTGCGFTRTDSLRTDDSPEARERFLADDCYGAALQRDAQQHAAKCRAAALPDQPAH
jgi:hypothetical protein